GVGAEDHRAPDRQAVVVDALDGAAIVASRRLQVELLVEELEGGGLERLESDQHPHASGLRHPVQDLVVFGDVDGREAEPVLTDAALRHLPVERHGALVRQLAVAVEVLIAPDHAAILPLELLELVEEVVDGALAVLAALEKRDEAELAGVRAPGRRDRRRAAVTVLLPQS